jgi:hypothetical protein
VKRFAPYIFIFSLLNALLFSSIPLHVIALNTFAHTKELSHIITKTLYFNYQTSKTLLHAITEKTNPTFPYAINKDTLHVNIQKSNTNPLHVTTQTNQPTTTSKVNSSNTNFGTSIGYSSEKTQATIGQGQITIRDKDNSDELAGLSRDVNNMNNLLYSGGIGLEVESVTKGVISKAIKGSVESMFNIQNAVQTISETDNILEIADNTLDVASNVFSIKNDAIAVVNGIDIAINGDKTKDDEKSKNGDEKQQKEKEITILDKTENAINSLTSVRDGVKTIDSSVNRLSGINNFKDIFQIDNINNINNFLSGIEQIDGALNKNNYIENFLNNSGSRYVLDKVYDINNGLDFIIKADGTINRINDIYKK